MIGRVKKMTVREFFDQEGLDKMGLNKKRLQAKIIDVRKKEREKSRCYRIVSDIETLNVIVYKQ